MITHDIARAARGIPVEGLGMEPLDGGFTDSHKAIITIGDAALLPEGWPPRIFVKSVDRTHPIEPSVIETEAKIYKILGRLGLCGELFPTLLDTVDEDGHRALLLTVIEGAEWGHEGSWTPARMTALDQALTRLHATPLGPDDTQELVAVHGAISRKIEADSPSAFTKQRERELFAAAWDAAARSFANKAGHAYFTTGTQTWESLQADSADVPPEQLGSALIMTDLNFGNIAFVDGRVMFVDPVYMRVGDPAHDRIVAGINILRREGFDSPEVTRDVFGMFIRDRKALARLTRYWVACTQLDLPETNDWMQFQQSCAVTALKAYGHILKNSKQ